MSSMLVALFWLSTQVNAQQMPSKADKQFEMGMYKEAAVEYERMINEGQVKEAKYYDRLAACYININQPFEAIAAYEECAMKFDMSADAYMKWASALKKIGKNEEANEIISFASIKDNVKFDDLEIVNALEYEIKPAPFNSEGNEFAPAYLGNDIVCVTDNYNSVQVTGVSTAINELPHLLMRVDASTGRKERLRGKLKDYINDGPTSYSDDGSMVCFSKGHFPAAQSPKIGNKQSGSIYYAETDGNGDWDVMVSLPSNELGVANIYPYVSADGNRVYFASNREGGFGGFDIYYTDRIGDGWTSPKNLGSKVNTAGDEISPSVDDTQLYFASNTHSGFGGYDVYSFNQEKNVGPVNLGEGVNSTWDDYALITKNEAQSGYFTSNRSGGAGGEDIYTFKRLANTSAQPTAVSVVTTSTSNTSTTTASAKPTTTYTSTTSTASAKPTTVSMTTNTATYAAPTATQVTTNYTDDVPTFKIATPGTDRALIKTIYTIQVAALSHNNNAYLAIADKLRDVGFVYKVFYHNVIKIRVGQFDNEQQARDILVKVKSKGYSDAFVVKEELIRDETHSVTKNQAVTTTTATTNAPTYSSEQSSQVTNTTPSYSTSTTNSPPPVTQTEFAGELSKERYDKALADITRYRIKLGSYTDMTAFDGSVVGRYGSVFKDEQDEWTKVYLGDYMTIEDAEAIRVEVMKAGFSSAIIYGMQDDQLIRIK